MNFFFCYLSRLAIVALFVTGLLVCIGLPTLCAALFGLAIVDFGAIHYLGRTTPKNKACRPLRSTNVPIYLN
ncbi:hypothetical protein [Fimbriimonas ginsengisoli]|uniref:Uncharacterized protein n=1 Tax=Fimbriimonas ginsengisoli Gsoil 348 TaxID=661478 RepID=A0A068NTV3_FIMGI|nr:hypothetical protein [Fimbriimonas ginsengisoli]AIE86190.1 hypothetical protein OP10G_2822 [Fimbriimonas ginsengisoli Gsoil 348]